MKCEEISIMKCEEISMERWREICSNYAANKVLKTGTYCCVEALMDIQNCTMKGAEVLYRFFGKGYVAVNSCPKSGRRCIFREGDVYDTVANLRFQLEKDE
jgi:hypothetical protein